jgi:flagellar hook-length control protein FliK
MATPINSNANAQSASPLSAELLARMQANAQGEPGAPGGFNAWMEKHALTPDTLNAAAAPQANKPKSPEAPARELSAAAARLLEQALNRSRQQAMSATHQAEQTAAQAAAAAQRMSAAPKPKADGAVDKVKDKDNSSDAQGDDEEALSTKASANASTEDSAIVSELTPPPEVKTDDVAAMMAWLASLTQGEASHGKKAALKGGGGGSEDTSGKPASTAALAADPRAEPGQGASSQASATPVSDTPVWQATQPTTALLQAEGSPSFKDELASQAGKDPVAGANGALSMRASPGWPTADVVGNRHESATLQAPVGSDTFAQALSDQLTMWVKTVPNDGPMTAELHLNPAELGPIHVKISLEGKDAQVDFAAAAVETRQAIEDSMNMLSTAFQDAGLTLTGGDVSAQTSQQGFQQAFGQSEGQAGQAGAGQRMGRQELADGPLGARAVAAPRPGRAGGLDLYA